MEIVTYRSDNPYFDEFICEFDVKPTSVKIEPEFERIVLGLVHCTSFEHEKEVFDFCIERLKEGNKSRIWLDFVLEFHKKYNPISKKDIIQAVDLLQLKLANKMIGNYQKEVKDEKDISNFMKVISIRNSLIEKTQSNAKIDFNAI